MQLEDRVSKLEGRLEKASEAFAELRGEVKGLVDCIESVQRVVILGLSPSTMPPEVREELEEARKEILNGETETA